jgi:hypothetical protein
MKLFERTGGYWLFYISAAYFIVGMANVFYTGSTDVWLAPLYIFFLAMPFWFPPLGRAINLDVTWDIKMFDWFKSREERKAEYNNVVKFPAPVPNVEPPAEPEKPAKIFYRIGVTDQNRIAFSMGMSEITMTKLGVQNMIDQLETFKSQLQDEEDANN